MKRLCSHVGLQDSLFLSLIIWLSVIPYISNLGFYSDDWAFLAKLKFSEDQSLLGLSRSFYIDLPNMWPRPVQATYLIVLYWLFGLKPLGFHFVNTAVFMWGIILFYWVLREFNQNRWLALTIPMIYGLLPHYSTARFWYAAYQVNLSMAFYFLSLYSDLRMVKARSKWVWNWKILSLASLLGSSLAYEVFMPLFLFNPLLVFYYRRRLSTSFSETQSNQRKLTILLGSNWLLLILVVVFKKMVSDRSNFGLPGIWFIKQSIKASISLTRYGDYGPQVIWKIISNYQNMAIFFWAGGLALIIFGYLYQLANKSNAKLPRRDHMVKLVTLGLILSGLSYGYFYEYFKVNTGINNRVAIAAAVGVAFSLVGGLGWISNLLNSSYSRKSLFCILISLLCSCGFLINNTIASFWVSAYRQQQEIVTDIRQQFPIFPAGSTLILDGFCPYIGPGIVFETDWDTTGMLKINYPNLTLKGNVIKSSLKIENNGISLSLYGDDESHYPYKQLFIYNFTNKIKDKLTDARAARRYFAKSNLDCPDSKAGIGVPIF